MKEFTVGIVGLGLIGASFAKGYKAATKSGEYNIKVLGYDIDSSVVLMGKISDTIDDELTPDRLVDCDIVVISVYPQACLDYMETNKDKFRKGGLVIDTCGNKRIVCDDAFKIANESGFTFVGCHPMAGTKYSGMAHAKATMFKGAPMVLVPEKFDDMEFIDYVKGYLEPLQFGSYCLSHADNHDHMIAFTSQMAHLVSNAYIKSPTAKSHKGFSAGSYKDMTRVAWLNPQMWCELFFENKDYLVEEIDILINEMIKYKEALVEDNREEMIRLLDEGRRIKEEVDG